MLKKALFTILIGQLIFIAPTFAENFYGVYDHSDKEVKDKSADQKIEYTLVKKSPVITLHGVESSGEGGCAYFKAKSENLKIDKSGNVSFQIGSRNLFLKRNKIGKKDNDGYSSAVLSFKGKFDKKSLTIQCSSENGYDCYVTKPIIFKKTKPLKF